MRPGQRALWQVNAAVLLFGFAGLFARWIGLSAIGVAFGRVAFSSLALLALPLMRRKPILPGDRNDLPLLVLAGAILLALFLLGETPSLRELAGAAIILAVVVWQQLREAKTAS